MGIYHFMGLGKSVGAVTAAFSYMAACKQKGGAAARRLFGLSGEEGEAEESRGAVQALVLFTTPEIRCGRERCLPYRLNPPGAQSGAEYPSARMEDVLRKLLGKELQPLARRPARADGPPRGIEFYWCDIALHDPILTFERVSRTLAAAKASGAEGKEVWINLTGGTNILNEALQLAASLTRSPARVYYLLTDNPDCVRHTTPSSVLGDEAKDTFWVDLPIVYATISELHRHAIEELATCPEGQLPVAELFNRLRAKPELVQRLAESGFSSHNDFLHGFVQPLVAQGFLVRTSSDEVAIGAGWTKLQRYYDAVAVATRNVTPLSRLPEAEPSWFFRKNDLAVE